MADVPQNVIHGFAALFTGGHIATDDPTDNKGFRPWENPAGGWHVASGPGFETAIADHLTNDTKPNIGVYPLTRHRVTDEPDEPSEAQATLFVTQWGCVDFDEGEEASLEHANNLQAVLQQLQVASWVERSRSKGYHLWVFFEEPLLARQVREGLIGACNVVDAPTVEVNPKQLVLTGQGLGNGVRLPYGCPRREGRNVVLYGGADMNLEGFVKLALKTRVTADAWKAVTALYSPPKALPAPKVTYTYGGGTLSGLAGAVRRGGPRPSADKPGGDRSATLFSLACAMVRQGFSNGDVLTELEAADKDWGNKFMKRRDGRQRLWDMTIKARNIAHLGTK
jgi:hypothetical protein